MRKKGNATNQNINDENYLNLKARSLGVERVLIIDWDVHAAQGWSS